MINPSKDDGMGLKSVLSLQYNLKTKGDWKGNEKRGRKKKKKRFTGFNRTRREGIGQKGGGEKETNYLRKR